MADTAQTPHERETADPMEWRFQDIGSVLYKRRWMVAASFLFCAGIVAAYTLTGIPIYQAQAQLMLADKSAIVTFEGSEDKPDDHRGYLETQYRLLQSRSLARRVVDELDLWNAEGFKPGNPASGGKFGFIKRWIGMDVASPASVNRAVSPVEVGGVKETFVQSAVLDRLLSNLTIAPVRDTRIIEVKYESPDPQLAARIVNALTNTYIKQDVEVRSKASKEALVWLDQQLTEQRRRVEDSEIALQNYREQKNSLSLEAGQNIVIQRLGALNSAVTQAKTDLIAVEGLYRQLAAGQKDRNALDTLPAIRSNSMVQEIRNRLANLQRERMQLAPSLGAKHPEMVRLDTAIAAAERELTAEVAKTVESVRQEYLAAVARERELTAALDKQKASALALNRQGIEYNVLLRTVESNREIYESLLQRANQTAVSSALKGSNIEVVDAAEVPRYPVRPNTRTNLLVGLLVSAVLAIGSAFVAEALDNRIRTPAAVRNSLGIPLLGMVPYVTKRSMKGKSLLLQSGVPAPYAEAFRALRTNILASSGAAQGRTLLVTSAAPGDGKSMVAANLAVAIGRMGSRVLVVDADLRRPMLHELFASPQRPGLSDVLTGARKPSEAIADTRCPGVWLLAAGTGLSNPSEQLGSKRFKEFLDKLSDSFDWVIVDSPPVMAVTDPAVLSNMVSGVLFVVNARQTQQRVAQVALDRLETAGASFAGAILNAVTLDRDHYYNTSYYLPFYGEYISKKQSA
jgi:capsular exopolysaccharide family